MDLHPRATGAFPRVLGRYVREQQLLTLEQAEVLANLFKVLANDTRLRLLHALARKGEVCVGELAASTATESG